MTGQGVDPRDRGLHEPRAGARDGRRTGAATSGHSVVCSTRCSPDGGRSAAKQVSDTLASVLRDEPDCQALPPAARPLAGVLRRLLEKDPARRLRDMGDVKLLMTDAERPPARPPVNVAARSRRVDRRRRRGGVAVGASVRGAAAAVVARRDAGAARRTLRAGIACGAALDRAVPAGTSPSLATDRLSCTRPARRPAISWSCGRSTGWRHGDRRHRSRQRSVLFARRPADRLRDPRRAATRPGGRRSQHQDLSPHGHVQRRELGPDDSIVFAQAGGLGLFRVPAAGGEPELIAAPDASKGERELLPPHGSSGWPSVLYTVALRGGQSRIVARRLAGGDATTVVESGFGAEYLASGHLLYAQDQRLMAVPFDPATLRTTGSPVPVQEDVSTKALAGVANVAAAGDGTIVYISGGLSRGPRHIVWVDPAARRRVRSNNRWSFRGIRGCLPTAAGSPSRLDRASRETSGSTISPAPPGLR